VKRVLGLDPSMRATGCVILQPQKTRRPMRWLMRELNSKEQDPLEAGVEQVHLLKGIIDEIHPEVCFIENFAFKGRGDRTIDLAVTQTCLRLALRSSGIPFYAVSPGTLKKFVIGAGKGDKKQMVKAVGERWDYASPTHNIADAFGLAMIGIHAMGYRAFDPLLTEKMTEAVLLVRGYLTAGDRPS